MKGGGQATLGIEPPLLVFGKHQDGIHVDLRKLIAGRLLVSGSSGAGKSRMIRYIAEQLATEIPQLVIDWEGEFASLREVHHYVWIGAREEGADIEIQANTARLVCRRLAGASVSVILDLSSLDYDGRRQVAGIYLDELMSLEPALRHPTLVMIDEAHELAPQTQDVASSPAVKRLVSQGRKRGYATIIATQRLSKLHKDVSEVTNRLIGRTVMDVDVKRAGDELGFDRRESLSLKRLKPGQWWAFGSAIDDGSDVILVRSGDVRSYHPDGSAAAIAVPTPSEIASALLELQSPSTATPEDAGRQELQEEIARLREQLRLAQEGNLSDPADIRRAVDASTEPLKRTIDTLTLSLERAKHNARAIILDLGELPPKSTESTQSITSTPEDPEDPGEPIPWHPDEKQLKMLALLSARGEMSATDLARRSGQGQRSSAFRARRTELLRQGLVTYPRRGFIALVPVSETPTEPGG